ncbi:MAG: polyprenyl synthetase family protein [Gammaproteobacteria bacterium]|nr:polyprenyl synthetase family protein [Gammaproteobacteria bacterium]
MADPARPLARNGFIDRLAELRVRCEAELDRRLPQAGTHPDRLHGAIRYSVMGGGKRLRPLLVYASGHWLGLEPGRLDRLAAAIELVHAYSLVHDDLPAMDDDDLRRGRPTVHVAYDDATALLVGDALQAQAYGVLATCPEPPEVLRGLIMDLAQASGSSGMAGGQALDVAATGRRLSADALEEVNRLKTGRLIEAAVLMPLRLLPTCPVRERAALAVYARAVGIAFQLADDLIDIESSDAVAGKPRGSDSRNGKSTWPMLAGLANARQRLVNLQTEAALALQGSTRDASGLLGLLQLIVHRDR